ncbi:MAG: EAL domain-containing protein [Betaproteobacteria bacterium]|nr:EAL domain-containing protein [Betaproteobacteria bacterium]
MKLLHRIWMVAALVLALATGTLAVLSHELAETRVEADVLKTARTLRDLLMTVRYTYHQRFMASGLPVTEQTLGFLPAHAISGISDDFRRFHAMGISFRNVSERARNPANQADATDIEAIRWFSAHPEAADRLVRINVEGDDGSFFYSTPIRVEPYCLACHGPRAEAPAGIRDRYEQGFGYRVGELRGILAIRLPLAAAETEVRAAMLREQAAHLAGFMLALSVGGLLMYRLVLRRLRAFNTGALRLAQGDYDTRLALSGADEISALAGTFNSMAAAIQQRDESLRQSQHRALSLFSNMSEGCVMHRLIRDAGGRPVDYLILEVNERFETQTGLRATEVVGKSGTEAYGCAEAPYLKEFSRVVETGSPLRMLRYFEPLNRHFDISVSPLDGDGFATLFTDITDRIVAELALSASEARANSILAVAPVGIGMVIDRVIMEVNDTLLRMTGYGREEMIGRSARFLYVSDAEYERVGKEKYAQIRERGMGSIETRWRRKDGEIMDIILSSAPIDPDDLGSGVTFTAQDITERRRAESALRESEVKFHTMVDWTYDWEYWINPDGSFHYMTPSVERVTGYGIEEFERDPGLIDGIVHPEDRPRWSDHVHDHLPVGSREEVCELDFRILRKQGDVRWVTHTCRPVFDHGKRYLGRRVTVRDITSRKDAEEQIRHLAYFDSLTGLPNRRLLLDRLDQALLASSRSKEHGALLVLDLDHFKTLNDTRGHDAGDRLLVEVARRLRACMRQEDTVARLGGDEYVVILENLGVEESTAARQAEIVAEKVRRELNEPYILDGLDQDHLSTPSIGLTLFTDQETPIDILLKQADVALYQAKDGGRNTVRFFNPAMQAAIDWRIGMENALRRGLRDQEFVLFYQPQIDHDGRLIGAEALLRWLPSGKQAVSPAQFIPLAEETGLILPLGQWVVDTACDQLKAWEGNPATDHLQIAINVSARQFHQPDFVARIHASLLRSGANPALLKLELTESVVLNNIDEVIHRMQQLRALGVGFSLDDFGTGYSSLSYLKRLPLDQLKIDQSFIRDIPNDPNDSAIVRAIMAMSLSLGLDVIAEGVETREQRDFLRENGCVAYQGYLFGRPMPINEWDALL